MKIPTIHPKKKNKKHILRLSLIDENDLKEIWNVRLYKSRLVLLITSVVVLLTIVLPHIFLRIPPVRTFFLIDDPNTLNSELIRQREKIDSLSFDVLLQKQYIASIKDILANNISVDTLQPFDTLKLMIQDKISLHKDSLTSAFINEYETKQSENMQPIGILPDPSIPAFFAPAHGKLIPYKKKNTCGLKIVTGDNANVYSVLRGVVINIMQQTNLRYETTILHEGYISIYRNIDKVFYKNGELVHSGDVIGFADDNFPIEYEIWQNGKNVNPQDLIVF